MNIYKNIEKYKDYFHSVRLHDNIFLFDLMIVSPTSKNLLKLILFKILTIIYNKYGTFQKNCYKFITKK